MKIFLRLAAPVCIAASTSAMAQPKIPPKYGGATPLEIAQLPKYCYQQYVDGSLGGYKFSIPDASCGSGMNHFCVALVAMMKAQNLNTRKAERIGEIRHAQIEVNYTISNMKPGCFIARDVTAAKQRADLLARIIK